MSAARLEFEWREQSWPVGLEDFGEAALLVRYLVRPRPEQRCPKCDSIIYSRRHPLCGACGRPLPSSFLFTALESRRVEETLQAERQRHRVWMAERN